MDLKAMSKTVEKYTLREALSYEDLYNVMIQSGVQFPGQFKLSKGILGKSIVFDVYMQVQPKVTIKDNVVTVRKMSNSSSVSVMGGPAIDIKASKQSKDAMKEGGFMKGITGGGDYFNDVCDLMREVLKDRIAE